MNRDQSNQEAVLDANTLGKIAVAVRDIEGLLLETGEAGTGKTLGELFYSHGTEWPERMRPDIRLVLKVRNGSFHVEGTNPPLTVSQLKRFWPATRRIIVHLEMLREAQVKQHRERQGTRVRDVSALSEGAPLNSDSPADSAALRFVENASNCPKVAEVFAAVIEIENLLRTAGCENRSLRAQYQSRNDWTDNARFAMEGLLSTAERCAMPNPLLTENDMHRFRGDTSSLLSLLKSHIAGSPVRQGEGEFASRQEGLFLGGSPRPAPTVEVTRRASRKAEVPPTLLVQVMALLARAGGRGSTLDEVLDSFSWPAGVETNLNIMIGVRSTGVSENGGSRAALIYRQAATEVLDEVSALLENGFQVSRKSSERATESRSGQSASSAKSSNFEDKPGDDLLQRGVKTLRRWRNSDNAYVRAAGKVVVGVAIVGGAVIAVRAIKDELS